MKKTLLPIAIAASALFALSAHAQTQAEPFVTCSPAKLTVLSISGSPLTRYEVACQLKSSNIHRDPQLQLRFSGKVNPVGGSPYAVQADYVLNLQDPTARHLGQEPREDQVATGTIRSSTASVASLPLQFAQLTTWDEKSQMLSIQEKPGVWHAFSIYGLDPVEGLSADEVQLTESSLQGAGFASAPVVDGQTFTRLVLNEAHSRFSSPTSSAAQVKVVQGVRAGHLEYLIGATRTANQSALTNAITQLDRQPKDITRAWALAAIAKFLGLADEVDYAEQKVAAMNPQLLEDFRNDVDRLESYTPASAEVAR